MATKSPGHQKWPDHKVEEKTLHERLQVRAGEETIADSSEAIEVDEDEHSPRFYIPRSGIDMQRLQKSETVTHCPFKGQASYYHLKIDGKTMENAAWSYEEPYEEHLALKDLIAFHDEKPEIEIRHID